MGSWVSSLALEEKAALAVAEQSLTRTSPIEVSGITDVAMQWSQHVLHALLLCPLRTQMLLLLQVSSRARNMGVFPQVGAPSDP